MLRSSFSDFDPCEQPSLSYVEDGKDVFYVGCGRAFGLHVKYPATPKKEGKATITLANSKTSMKVVGEFTEPGGPHHFRAMGPRLSSPRPQALRKGVGT